MAVCASPSRAVSAQSEPSRRPTACSVALARAPAAPHTALQPAAQGEDRPAALAPAPTLSAGARRRPQVAACAATGRPLMLMHTASQPHGSSLHESPRWKRPPRARSEAQRPHLQTRSKRPCTRCAGAMPGTSSGKVSAYAGTCAAAGRFRHGTAGGPGRGPTRAAAAAGLLLLDAQPPAHGLRQVRARLLRHLRADPAGQAGDAGDAATVSRASCMAPSSTMPR